MFHSFRVPFWQINSRLKGQPLEAKIQDFLNTEAPADTISLFPEPHPKDPANPDFILIRLPKKVAVNTPTDQTLERTYQFLRQFQQNLKSTELTQAAALYKEYKDFVTPEHALKDVAFGRVLKAVFPKVTKTRRNAKELIPDNKTPLVYFYQYLTRKKP